MIGRKSKNPDVKYKLSHRCVTTKLIWQQIYNKVSQILINGIVMQLYIKLKPSVNDATNNAVNDEEIVVFNKITRILSDIEILKAQSTYSVKSS